MKLRVGLFAGAFGAALLAGSAAQAGTININFADYANTFLSSADGVNFSLDPAYAVNGDGTTPYVNVFGYPEIGNGTNGDYPSSDTLIFSFSSPASNISFGFDNEGTETSGRGASFYDAYDASNNLIASGFLGDINGGTTVDVTGSNISTLVFNNNTGDPTGDTDSWLFGVTNLSATTSAVPEPLTISLFGAGLAGAVAMRRRKKTVKA